MKLFHMLSAILFCQIVLAQTLTCAEIEKDLAKTGNKIEMSYQMDFDTLEVYSLQFDGKMSKYIRENTETLRYPFQILIDSNYCHIATSSDKLLRIYSWDTQLGGTMRQFSTIYQYQFGTKILSEDSIQNLGADDTTDLNPEEDDSYDPGTFCSAIHTLKANNRTYYLAISNGIYSTKDCSQDIQCFTIENGKLNRDVKLFKTAEGMTSKINVYFDFFTVVDRPERPLKLIKYDEEKRLIYIPIVYENGNVTNRFIVYKFNGDFFERLKTSNKKGKKR